jgi:hypothetical protein
MVNRELPGRYAWTQAAIRRAAAVLLLLTMAFFYGLVVDIVESAVPFPVLQSCKSSGWAYVISIPSADYNCEWEGSRSLDAKWSTDVQLTETSHNVLTATVTISTTKADPLVSEVQRGDAQRDPVSFEEDTVGYLQAAGLPFSWSAPVVQQGAKPGQDVRITLGGVEPADAAGERTEIDFYPASSGALRLTGNGAQVTGVEGESSVTAEAGNSVTLDYSFGEVVVDLTKTGVTSPFDGPTVTIPSAVVGALTAAGRIIREFGESLLSAVPWIVFFFLLAAGRSAGLRLTARRPVLLRMTRLLGAVLLAHLIVWGAVAIGAQDSFFSRALASSFPFSGYAPVSGATVLFASLVVYGAFPWSGSSRSRSRSYRHRRAMTWTAASALSGAVALLVLIWLLRSPDGQGSSLGPSAWLYLAGAIGVPILLIWLGLLILGGIADIVEGTVRGRPTLLIGLPVPRAWHYLRLSAPIAGVTVFLAVMAATTGDSGYLPLFVRWAGLIGAGTVMGLAVVRLATGTLRHLRPRRARGTQGRRPSLRYWVPVAAAFAVPWGIVRAGGQPQPVGWSTIPQYAVRLDDLLPLVLVGGGIVLFRGLGERAVTQEPALREHRVLGIGAWFIVLSSSYTFASSASMPAAAAMAAAAAAGWLLMPGRQVAVAGRILRQTQEEQSRAVADVLRAGAARRVIPAYSKALRDKLSTEELQFDQVQDKIDAMEQRAVVPLAQLPGGAGTAAISTDQLGFGALASRSPWGRGMWGARWGAIIGAPWVLLGVAGGAIFNVGPGEGYPELAIAAFVAPLVLRWVAYGFLFGYFYPLIRGGDGLSKALWLSAVAVVPALVSTLSVENAGASRWESMALLAVQIAAFGTTMGLLADREVLRKHRLPAGRIVDLHNLWSVSAWGSSIGLAVATGVATVIISGLQPFVIGTVAPSTVPVTQQVTPPGNGNK